jgi:hypothetical protein
MCHNPERELHQAPLRVQPLRTTANYCLRLLLLLLQEATHRATPPAAQSAWHFLLPFCDK